MFHPKNQSGQDEAANGGTPRVVLKTRTAFQIYKNDGAVGSAGAFGTLPNDELLPYKIKSSELTLVAALDVVEADTKAQRMYGPATLHLVINYLSDLLSFIPLGGRSHDAPIVTINYGALQRVVVLYGSSEEVKKILKELETSNPTASAVPIRDLSVVLHNFSDIEKSLRHEMRDAGEKVGVFAKSTVSSSLLSAGGGEAAAVDDNSHTTSGTPSRKRPANSGEELTATGEGGEEGEEDEIDTQPPSKLRKVEENEKSTHTVKKRTSSKPVAQCLVFGRLRTLTSQEKKVVTVFNQMIQLLGQVYAVRYNNLLPIFDLLENRVKHAQEIIDMELKSFASRSEEAETTQKPFLEVSLDNILQAIHNGSHLFKTDEECRYELDEDLLHPIAHACMTEVNRIEGFTTTPFEGLSAEAQKAKEKAREAARAKREEQRTKALERAKAKEELETKKEEERRLIRAHLGELDPTSLVEDISIKNPVKTAYVRYSSLPLETPEQYERALFIWAMITSLPKPFMLSQMPFSLFLKGLLSDEGRDNGLMEEVVQALLDVVIENPRSSKCPKIVTRGKDWFDAMVEFVAVTSGNKKTRPPRGPKAVSYDNEEEEEEKESDDEESDETEEEDEEETGTDEAEDDEEEEGVAPLKKKEGKQSPRKKAKKEEEVEEEEEDETKEKIPETEPDGLDAGIKITMEHIAELRQMAAWGNVDMEDRLNLLQYMLLEALSSSAAQEEAEKIRKMHEEMQQTMEKRTKEIRDETHKEIASLLKKYSASSKSSTDTSETYEEKREKLIEEMEQRLQKVVNENLGIQDGRDIGALISPLGMDRYRRVYWRFPFDRHVVVQTTGTTDPNFPILPEPKEILTEKIKNSRSILLDDAEEEEHNSKPFNGHGPTKNNDDPPQRVWGVVPPEYLAHFIKGLDQRGAREAGLRRALEAIQSYLLNMTETPVGRVTRMRAHNFGYLNKLRPSF